MQKIQRLAFQGVRGAFAHLACQQFYPQATAVPYPSFESAMQAAASGETDGAVIPIENSTAGRVAGVHLLLHSNQLTIRAEHFLPVNHQLLALPGATLADIKQVVSHPQALAQCHGFLSRHQIEAVGHSNTAGAAADVASWGDSSKAAIASSLAAEIYGLQLLASDIEDEGHNTTRFLLLQPADATTTANPRDMGAAPLMTSLFFRVRNVPAALFKALGGFATNGINLLKIESFIEDGQFTAALFYLEALGSPFDGDATAPSMRFALEELGFFSDSIRQLGTYPADPYRFGGQAA